MDEQDIEVESMSLTRKRGLEMQMRHPAFAALADGACRLLEEYGGDNYLEFGMCSDKHGPMTVLIQRDDGETPAQQNVRLRARIAELEQDNATQQKGAEHAEDESS